MIEASRSDDLDISDAEVLTERSEIVRDYLRMADGVLAVLVDVGVKAEIGKQYGQLDNYSSP